MNEYGCTGTGTPPRGWGRDAVLFESLKSNTTELFEHNKNNDDVQSKIVHNWIPNDKTYSLVTIP